MIPRARARLQRVAAHFAYSAASQPPQPPATTATPLSAAFAGVEEDAAAADAADDAPTSASALVAKRWDGVWRRGVSPGQKGCFDAGGPPPALLDLLFANPGSFSVAGRRVLVPGCGRGYALPPFASAGAAAVVGLEASDAAADAAEAYLSGQLASSELVRRKCSVRRGDFFRLAEEEGGQGRAWARAFDCTFLCALPPGMRGAWARAYARLLLPGDGELVVLLFPVEEQEDEKPSTSPPRKKTFAPPPWPVDPSETDALLAPHFERVALAPVPAALSHPSRAGREWLGRWRRRAAAAEA